MNHKQTHADKHAEHGKKHSGKGGNHAETAAEEVFDEVEAAETRLPDHRHDGEAGDTLTPSPEAQEEIHENKKRDSR
ncbi:hypothetical protein [Streptomyces flavofungini]|uniref:hypothetical protein n=1 Tax=Streptomyces flavofungini TaxID=68200 RepID=UPI0034DEA618